MPFISQIFGHRAIRSLQHSQKHGLSPLYSTTSSKTRCLTCFRRHTSSSMLKDMVYTLDVQLNLSELITLLHNCHDVDDGNHIHAYIIQTSVQFSAALVEHILQMYARFGRVKEVEWVLHSIDNKEESQYHNRSNSVYNSILAAYAQNGHTKFAMCFLHEMQQKNMVANKFTLVKLISASSGIGFHESGQWLHNCILWAGYEDDVVVATALVSMYGKYGLIKEAQLVFDEMPERNVISWTALITIYTQNDQGELSRSFFVQMLVEGVIPNQFTLVSTLSRLSGNDELNEGKCLHALFVGTDVDPDVVLGTSLVTMYTRCNSLEDAKKIFDSMVHKNVFTWTAMVMAYSDHGQGDKALFLYEQMRQQGINPNNFIYVSVLHACTDLCAILEGKQVHADIVCSGCDSELVVGNAMLDFHGKCGILEDAISTFYKMPHHDVVSCTSIISAFANAGLFSGALQSFLQMKVEGVLPNEVTFVNLLSACKTPTTVDTGKLLHAYIVGSGFENDLLLGTALISMYTMCGSSESAKKIFDKMPERDIVAWNNIMAECDCLEDVQKMFDDMPVHDEVSWNILISAHIHSGCYGIALTLFQEMLFHDIVPTKYTLVTTLEACGILARLSEGRRMHVRILLNGYETETIAGNALIHMYSKIGCFEDAQVTFRKMQVRDVVSWTTMIAVYAQYGQARQAILAFQELQFDDISPNEITFLNTLYACSHAGLETEALIILSIMLSFSVPLILDHFNCILDLYGRLGQVMEGEHVIQHMPFQPNATLWLTLLSACKMHNHISSVHQVVNQIIELKPDSYTAYVLLHNTLTNHQDHVIDDLIYDAYVA